MVIEAGQQLAQYRLVEKIGEGGMGVVWKAVDTTLDREVAIKILPDSFSEDAERVSRFEREAKLLASLNHPNIAAIYGLHEHQGTRFLAMELVAGEDLQQRLDHGAIPLDEILDIGRQVAEALEAAHENGVIHRDLKPANVQLTPQGKVKVLDFGLAKAFEVESTAHSRSLSPTLTSAGTVAGVILGTAAYMSPEQARGKGVDKRVDIWAFGCLLYEMCQGDKAFDGETVSDCIARILEREPDIEALPERVPPRVRELIHRCLRKDPYKRLRDIGEARLLLEDPEAVTVTPPLPVPVRPGSRERNLVVLAGLAVVSALVGAFALWLWVRETALPKMSLSRGISEMARLTQGLALSEGATWSPDGSLLAFASNRSGNFEIFVRQIEGGDDVNISKDASEDFQPAFSPDGKWIAFISTRSSRTGLVKISSPYLDFRTFGGDLWVIPALGGQARRLAPDANTPSWHPDGQKIMYVSGNESHRTIMEVDMQGGAPRVLIGDDTSTGEIVRAHYTPDGRWISYELMEGEVFLIPIEGGEPRKLVEGGSHFWASNGKRLYYLVRNSLGGTRILAAGFEPARGEVVGEPETIGLMMGALRDLAVSPGGAQLVVSDFSSSRNLTRLPLTPDGVMGEDTEELLRPGPGLDSTPAYAPDGRRIAYLSNRLRPWDIWILDLQTRSHTRLNLPHWQISAYLFPSWLPDSRSFVITRIIREKGQTSVWRVAHDGSDSEEILPDVEELTSWLVSPDGLAMLFTARSEEGFNQLFRLDMATRERTQLTNSKTEKYEGAWSPDNRWIAYIANEEGETQIWRLPAGGGEAEHLISDDERMRHIFYSPDGRWIYVQLSHRNVYRLPAAGGPLEKVTDFPESGLFLEEPAISPDGRNLVYCRSHSNATLWLLSLGETR